MIFGKKAAANTQAILNDPQLQQMYGNQIATPNSVLGTSVPPWIYGSDTIRPADIRKSDMEHENDIIIRKVSNGYNVIVTNGYGQKNDVYVAKDLDEVADVLKQASVKRVINEAK